MRRSRSGSRRSPGARPPGTASGSTKGRRARRSMLRNAYKLILDNRAAWHVQRLFWYHWRDPLHTIASCTLLLQRGAAAKRPQPQARARGLQELQRRLHAADRQHHVRARPGGASSTTRLRRSRSTSSRAGSTFQCQVDASASQGRAARRSRPPLSNGGPRLLRPGGRRRRERERAPCRDPSRSRPDPRRSAPDGRSARDRGRVRFSAWMCRARVPRWGSRLSRVAVVLGVLAVSLADHVGGAGRRALRVLRDRPDGDARRLGRPGDAGGQGEDQPLRPQLGRGGADSRLASSGTRWTGSSGPWPRTAFARSPPCGATRAGCPAPLPLPRSGAPRPSSSGATS